MSAWSSWREQVLNGFVMLHTLACMATSRRTMKATSRVALRGNGFTLAGKNSSPNFKAILV